ncbi:hypothetical protein VNO77_03170 [Canavalia gladiata]|uniref:Uncharacterized protein n=1 Tax=Canavalia gladiata TaxID=3824 RepID=A0AAN9R6K5_CANGL
MNGRSQLDNGPQNSFVTSQDFTGMGRFEAYLWNETRPIYLQLGVRSLAATQPCHFKSKPGQNQINLGHPYPYNVIPKTGQSFLK